MRTKTKNNVTTSNAGCNNNKQSVMYLYRKYCKAYLAN